MIQKKILQNNKIQYKINKKKYLFYHKYNRIKEILII